MEGIDKVQGKRKKTRPPRGAARRSIHSHVHSHLFEVRRKAVQLYLEEGFPLELIAREMGVGQSTLSKWVRLYRDHGEAGLKSQEARPSGQRPRVAAAVKTKVVELKRRHPDLGIQKISQFLRRVLFLPVSRETVRRTLHEQLLKKRKPQPQRHPPQPRFFERTTPQPDVADRYLYLPSGRQERLPHRRRALPWGEAGSDSDAPGAGVARAPRTGTGPESETGAVAGAPSPPAEGKDGQTGEAAGQAPRTEITTADQVDHPSVAGGSSDERSETHRSPASLSASAGTADYAGAERVVECPGSSPATADLPQDLLQVGATGLGGDGRGAGQSGTRAPAAADRPGEGSPPTPEPGASGPAPSPGADGADPPVVGAAG